MRTSGSLCFCDVVVAGAAQAISRDCESDAGATPVTLVCGCFCGRSPSEFVYVASVAGQRDGHCTAQQTFHNLHLAVVAGAAHELHRPFASLTGASNLTYEQVVQIAGTAQQAIHLFNPLQVQTKRHHISASLCLRAQPKIRVSCYKCCGRSPSDVGARSTCRRYRHSTADISHFARKGCYGRSP